MKPKTLMLMVVAVTCGLGASYMTSRLLAQRNEQVQEQPKLNVLVAKKALNMGMMVKNIDDAFTVKEFIVGQEPKNAILEPEKIKGKQLKRNLRAGDFVTPDDLMEEFGSTVAANLPKGFRAVGLRVNLETVAGGWASLPHSRVDIISTIRRGDDKRSFSQILLQNVLILAVDTQNHRSEQGNAMPGSVVVVALSPADALKMTVAKNFGELSLALRGFGENTIVDEPKATFDDVANNRQSKKGNDDVDVQDEPTSPTPVIASLPMVPKEAPKVEEPKNPVANVHSIVIIEGDRERKHDYAYNQQGQLIRPEVTSGPVATPAPTPVATPRPPLSEPTPPAVPDRPE